MADGTGSRSWRRYLRFSVRGLIALVLVIGGGLGWMVRSARIQREAVAAIRQAGGRVTYDWEYRDDGSPSDGCSVHGWPKWIVDAIGVDYFDHVVSVSIMLTSSCGVTDAGLASLSGLKKLRSLRLSNEKVTDAGLLNLKGLTGLEHLDLSHTKVTGASLRDLKGLPNLKYLDLQDTEFTDDGLLNLQELRNLEALHLQDTHVSDEGLSSLKGFSNLQLLVLLGTYVSDDGVNELQQALPHLKIYH